MAINGFGRIGRNFVRCWHGRKNSNLELVAVNDSGGVKQASHLLKYDSILGTFDAEIKIISDTEFSVDGKKITVVSARDPLKLPWKEMNIDLVIEGTGVFIDSEGAGKHITAGAKKVIITAPAKGKDIPTYVVGVNADQYKHSDTIISNASCTTNCLAPFAKVLHEKFGAAQTPCAGAISQDLVEQHIFSAVSPAPPVSELAKGPGSRSCIGAYLCLCSIHERNNGCEGCRTSCPCSDGGSSDFLPLQGSSREP